MESWKTIAVLCAVFCTGYCEQLHNVLEQKTNTSEAIDIVSDFFPALTDLENKCRLQTNSNAAFNRITATRDKFIHSCLLPLLEIYTEYEHTLPHIITNLSDRSTLQKAINKICGGFSKLKKCLRPSVNAILVCMTPTEGKNMNSIWKALYAGTDYACHRKGARYIELLETGVEECVKSREVGIAKCEEKLKHLTKNETETVFEFNSKNCNLLSGASSCAVEELKQCPNKRSAEIVGELVGVVLKELCDFDTDNSSRFATISNWIRSRFSQQ